MRSLASLALLGAAGFAAAFPINVASTGAGLSIGDTDTNWTINGLAAKVSDQHPAWGGGTAVQAAGAKWINPSGLYWTGEPHGIYDYTTTFDLSGYDQNTALLNILWTSDNESEVYLNGNLVGATTGGSQPFFSNFTLNLTSGFVPGVNTLTFKVTNGNTTDDQFGPTGLIAAVNGSVQAVPEPATMAVLGLGALGLLRRKRAA